MTNDLKKRKAIENYWLKRLAGDPPVLSLPKLNTETPTDGKATYKLDVPAPVSQQLMEIANQSDMGVFVLFFCGLNLTAAGYTGIEDLMIGTVAPRKEGVKKDKLLLSRNSVPGDKFFKEVVGDIKSNVLEDFNHTPDEYSFGLLYQRLLENSGKDSLEIFNIACIYDKIQNNSRQLKQFDLLFVLSNEENGLALTVDYNAALYSEEIVRRFCRNLIHLLGQLRELLELKIKEINILCSDELLELMDLNKTSSDYPHDKTVHQLFEEQVERTPDHMAVIGMGQRLTYRELNEKANRMAHLLREKGVGPGDIVAILKDRSPDTVAALLAILKAGAAYLPMDPSMPKNRILTMLNDSRAELLITENHILSQHSFVSLQGLKEKKAPVIRTSRRKQLADLDTLPIPDRSMVNYEKYNRYIGQVMVKNIISLQTARGCPYDCAYCSKIWSRKHVFRSADEIFKEMKIYYDMGFRRFSIFDDIFNVNAANGMKFFEKIISSDMDVQLFFPNGLRGDLLTKEYIDLLVEAGLASTALALETASPRMQSMINKNLKLDIFRENVEYFCNKHPHVILELFSMHGFPTETEEEARMTMNFIKEQRWLHFPYVFILKIYPDTDMADLAMKHGVIREDILKSEDLAFHELSPTSPFESSFTKNYQAEFLNEYFLLKERLLHVLPYQAKVLTQDEITQKYDSYLPYDINSFQDILDVAGIKEEELKIDGFRREEEFAVPDLNRKLRDYFPVHKPAPDALRVLLLDLTQYFTNDTDMLYDVVEPPLGAMYIMTYLNEQLGDKVNGKIAKSRIDFDSYRELKTILEEFRPDVIGVRSLTFYRDFFHQTVGMLRLWGFGGPIIAGGPYATRNVESLIQDKNIDILAVSEGEATFLEVIQAIMENGGKLPEKSVLESITGIAFVPRTASGSREVLAVDLLGDELLKRSAVNPENLNSSSDMAYIIYTSGSTGIPKGVVVEHRNAVNVLDWFARTYNLTPDTHVIQLTSFTFDPSVEQVFGTLNNGAVLYMGGKELTADKEALAEFVKENNIHVFNFVPSGLKELLGENERLESVKVVISGAEKLEDSLKNNLLEKGYALYNHYGPTETTIEALTEMCSTAPVTLGRPIANIECYVMSPNGIPVPVGVEGELYIGGVGVSRGYLNNPELTAERFVDLNRTYKSYRSYGSYLPKEKLYKTGDRVRQLPDGRIEFLGRIDHQVKIRGLRIELGEIEYQLKRHSRIKDAVVIALKRTSETPPDSTGTGEDTSLEDALCAYIVSESPVPESELREYLIMELPPYMIPDFFVTLDKIPLTSNGKLDRKALPEPWADEAGPTVLYAPPTNEMEEILVEVWQGVLGKEKVGINDNFFTSGGDSVKSIQILSRMKKAGYKVEMTEIFRYPTIAQLAPLVKKVEHEADQTAIQGKIPLTPTQIDFFSHINTSRMHLFNRVAILHFRGGLDEDAVKEIFTRLQNHHDVLRITFGREDGGTVVQMGRGEDMPLALEVFDLKGLENAPEILGQKIGIISEAMDMENGPLMKLGLIKMDDGDRLCMVIHSLLIDFSSWLILLEDIDSLYRQYNENKRGSELFVPKKTDSFKLWSEKLAHYASANPLVEEKKWWQGQESIQVPNVVEDENQRKETGDMHCASFTLDESLTAHLVTQANEAYGTEVNDILLTALGLALTETFEPDRFLISLEASARDISFESLTVTRTVGPFAFRFPAILDVSHPEDKSRQLVEIKDYLRRFPNKGFDYGVLKSLTPPDLKMDVTFTHEPYIGFNPLLTPEKDEKTKSFDVRFQSPSQSIGGLIPIGFPLEVTPFIKEGSLTVFCVYNPGFYQDAVVEALVRNYETNLRQLITLCMSRETEELTPGDMDYKELSVEEMDSIFD